MNIETEPFSPAVVDAYRSLLPHQSTEIERGKLAWKFAKAPAGPGLSVVARVDDATIAAICSFQRVHIDHAAGDAILGVQAMDLMVNEAIRGKGVFTGIFHRFYRENFAELIYGFPNHKSSVAFFSKLGWTKYGSIPMLVRPLPAGWTKIGRRWSPRLRDRGVEAPPIRRFHGEHVDRIWANYRGKQPTMGVRRDAAYLNWRLFDCPSAEYLVLGDDDHIVVGRVADKHGTRIGYLMEAMGADNRRLTQLIHQMFDHFVERGSTLSFAWSLPHAANYAAHRAAGYLPWPEPTRPIHINFGAKMLQVAVACAPPASAWYVSYLDSDTV